MLKLLQLNLNTTEFFRTIAILGPREQQKEVTRYIRLAIEKGVPIKEIIESLRFDVIEIGDFNIFQHLMLLNTPDKDEIQLLAQTSAFHDKVSLFNFIIDKFKEDFVDQDFFYQCARMSASNGKLDMFLGAIGYIPDSAEKNKFIVESLHVAVENTHFTEFFDYAKQILTDSEFTDWFYHAFKQEKISRFPVILAKIDDSCLEKCIERSAKENPELFDKFVQALKDHQNPQLRIKMLRKCSKILANNDDHDRANYVLDNYPEIEQSFTKSANIISSFTQIALHAVALTSAFLTECLFIANSKDTEQKPFLTQLVVAPAMVLSLITSIASIWSSARSTTSENLKKDWFEDKARVIGSDVFAKEPRKDWQLGLVIGPNAPIIAKTWCQKIEKGSTADHHLHQ